MIKPVEKLSSIYNETEELIAITAKGILTARQAENRSRDEN